MRVTRTSRGRVRVSFDGIEQRLLTDLTAELVALMHQRDASPEAVRDPALERLLPDAYRGDAEAAFEFRRFTEDELVAVKTENAHALSDAAASVEPIEFEEPQLLPVLRAITDLRLALATRLGIESDDDDGDDSLEARPTRAAYWWLGELQERLLAALSG